MLTVLLTTYNDCKFLKYSINSILSQSFTNFELLIIDDGSKDDTYKVVENFNDHRITYHYIEHQGRSYALNFGLKLAKYDWLVLADADDIMYPDKLKIYSEYISDKIDRIVWSDCFYFDKNKVLFFIKNPVDEYLIKKHFVLHSINNLALINRKHIFQHTDGYSTDLNKAEDYDLWLKMIVYSELIVVPKFLTLINLRLNSFSRADIKQTNSQIYGIQKNLYIDDGIRKFGIKDKNEIAILNGWREFFYGDKEQAKFYFLQLGIGLIFKPRILIAYFLCYLTDDFLLFYKSLVLKYRFLYLLNYFSKESSKARKLLKQYY